MMKADVEVLSVVSENEHRNEDEADEAIVGSEKEHWNEEIVETYREFLLSGKKTYPDLPTRKRRNFRNKAEIFLCRKGSCTTR